MYGTAWGGLGTRQLRFRAQTTTSTTVAWLFHVSVILLQRKRWAGQCFPTIFTKALNDRGRQMSKGHSPKRPPKAWNVFKPSSFILKIYTYFMLHYNFFKKITHHPATSGRCSIFNLCHTLGQWILRTWLFILLHNFRNILFPLEFRFTSGYLFSLYY